MATRSKPGAATTLEFHPLADAFPLLEGDEFRDLVDDIKANGLREAIWLHEDRIIDGRNRYRACLDAGVAPKFRDWDGRGSLVAFVVSMNVNRRHLDDSQRAMAAGKIANLGVGSNQHEAKGSPIGEGSVSQAEAAALLSVGKRSVERAVELLSSGVPELVEAVERGEVAVSAAAEVASLSEEEQREVVEEGPKAIKAKAKELREGKAHEPKEGKEPKPFDVAAASERLRDLVKAEAHKWPKSARAILATQLRTLINIIEAGAI